MRQTPQGVGDTTVSISCRVLLNLYRQLWQKVESIVPLNDLSLNHHRSATGRDHQHSVLLAQHFVVDIDTDDGIGA